MVTKDFEKIVESDINEVLIEEQKREDDKTIIIPKGLVHYLELLDKEQKNALNVVSTQKQL
jgi:hypothetical protein